MKSSAVLTKKLSILSYIFYIFAMNFPKKVLTAAVAFKVSFLNSKVQFLSMVSVRVKMSTGAGECSTLYTISYDLSEVWSPAAVK